MSVTGPGWASGAQAALDLLGLGSTSGAAVRLDYFSRQPPDWRVEVTCPAGNAGALTLELFPPADDRRHWLEGHGIAIAYRMSSGAVDPRGHPEPWPAPTSWKRHSSILSGGRLRDTTSPGSRTRCTSGTWT